MSIGPSTNPEKIALRERIKRQTQEFLARKKKIAEIPPGVSAIDDKQSLARKALRQNPAATSTKTSFKQKLT